MTSTKEEKKGLAYAAQIYQNREARMRELKQHGQRIIGYLCSLAPPELLTAAKLVPYRITGDMRRQLVSVDSYLEANLCPYGRNCFDRALNGDYDFLDGIVMSHTCDAVHKIYGLWYDSIRLKYSYFVNAPHTRSDSSRQFFKHELLAFKESIERFTGERLSDQRLKGSIKLHNENRRLVRQLYDLRKGNPPLISGVEMTKLLVSGASLPASEFNILLKQVHEEIVHRDVLLPARKARLFIWGCIIDDVALSQLIESLNAWVVVDDTCIGTKSYWCDVDETIDPIDALTQTYFMLFDCPRMYRGSNDDKYKQEIDLATEFHANGVVAYMVRFCDPHMLEFPDFRDALSKEGLPVLHLVDDYTLANIGAVRTRVEALIEMIT